MDDREEERKAEHLIISQHLKKALMGEPKKQWVGLTVNEARKFYEKYTNRAELIYVIDKFLEEKNT